MEIKNFTPHPINILDENNDEIVTIPPIGIVIRLKSTTVWDGNVNGIPITRTVFGAPHELPEQRKGVFLIVSQLIKSALPERTDLLVPAQVVRNSDGMIIGCQSLSI